MFITKLQTPQPFTAFTSFQNHHNCFTFNCCFTILVCAGCLKSNNGSVLSNFCYGRGCRNHIADKGGRGKLHRLRKVDDLTLLEFVTEYRRNKCAAEHSMCNPPTKSR